MMVDVVKGAREGYKVTEFGSLPNEWDLVRLGITMNFINGRAFKPEDWGDNGLPIIRIQNLNGSKDFNYYAGEYQDKYYIKNGQLLFSWSGSRGTSFGPFIWNYKEGLLNQHIFKVEINSSLNKLYAFYALKNITINIEREAHGSAGLVHVTKKALEDFLIPIPPLKEQQKIAEILSTVDEQIENTDKLIEKTKELKKGLMQQLLTKGIGHTEFKQTEIGKIPIDWGVKKIGEFAEVEYGISESVSQNHDPNIGIPIITGANITLDGRLNTDKLVYIKPKSQERFKLKKGDLLFNWRSGSQQHIGKTTIFNLDGEYTFASFILKIRLGENFDNMFYFYLINYFKETGYFFKDMSMQVNFKLNAASFREIEFPIPEKSEQQKVAEILSSVDDQIESYELEKEKYTELKKGLMQQLLTGKIRVTV